MGAWTLKSSLSVIIIIIIIIIIIVIWQPLELGRVGDVGQFIKIEPVLSISAVKVVLPVTDAVLLVEGGVVGAHVRDTASIFVAHVEKLTVEFLVSVETYWAVRAVESEGHVRELFPSLRSMQGLRGWQGADDGHGKTDARDDCKLSQHLG